MTKRRVERWLAAGGVVGPLAFIAAWAVLGARRAGYSPIEDPISRLAAVGSPTRPAMTAGLVAFGVGVTAYAAALRSEMPSAATTAAATAVASFAIAATPLDSSLGGGPHAAAAGVAYATLAATPILGARHLSRRGDQLAARASVVAGLVSGAALLASATLTRGHGLLQRAGLTAGDLWIIVTASSMVVRRGSAYRRDR